MIELALVALSGNLEGVAGTGLGVKAEVIGVAADGGIFGIVLRGGDDGKTLKAPDAKELPLGHDHALDEYGFDVVIGLEAVQKKGAEACEIDFGLAGDQDGLGGLDDLLRHPGQTRSLASMSTPSGIVACVR